ncbi:hypothetical protein J2Z31_001745 [Sinorhizobium kostiense]|uniref:Uncharacterized protein n=1 Tax=Sinorhizobium kostiense TaxID=76747 RepID=A0ABS4QX87_9HYPH|nr:hypothetical protein [Sinorhizobium kostiense]
MPRSTTTTLKLGSISHNEDVIKSFIATYGISRSEAIIMAGRETPKERLRTYLEWLAGQKQPERLRR